MLLSTGSVGKK